MSLSRILVTLLAVVSLSACGDKDDEDGGSGGTNDTSVTGGSSCSSEFSCYNDICECADGTSCSSFDLCQSECEVCN